MREITQAIYMENEKYSLEKANEEAEKLQKKVESGEVRNYSDAENKLEKEEHYQNLVWKLPTDDEVKKLVREVDVNPFDDPVNRVQNVKEMFKRNPELMKRTGTDRLIDLGSGSTFLRDSFAQLDAESIGIKEYIAVDLDINDSELKERDAHDTAWHKKRVENYVEPPSGERLRIKTIKQELLTALHSFPDDYGNAWMTGIEAGNIIRNYERWGFAVLAELKRVVPENGFIVTDRGFIDTVLARCIPEFEKVSGTVRRISGWMNRPSKDEEQKIKKSLEEYEVKEGDPFYHEIKYIVNAPEIGFKVYFDEVEAWQSKMILVNSRKSR